MLSASLNVGLHAIVEITVNDGMHRVDSTDTVNSLDQPTADFVE